MKEFAETVSAIAASTKLSAENAALFLARYQNITGLNSKELVNFSSALIALGNNSAATEQQISDFSLRIASAADIAGFSSAEILAFSTTLASAGMQSQAAGSSISRLINNINLAVSTGAPELEHYAIVANQTSQEFSQLFKDNPAEAVFQFIAGLDDVNRLGMNTIQVLDEMNISEIRVSDTLRRLSNAEDVLKESLILSNAEFEKGTALQIEAEKRYETTASQIQIMNSAFDRVKSSIGDSFLPIINDIVSGISTASNTAAEFAEDNQTLIQILGILGASVTTGAGILGSYTVASKALNLVQKQLAVSAGAAGAAQGGFLKTLVSSNVGKLSLALTGLVAVLGTVAIAYNNHKENLKQSVDLTAKEAEASTKLTRRLQPLAEEFETLAKIENRTIEEETRLKTINDELIKTFGTKNLQLQDLTSNTDDYIQKIRQLTAEEQERNRVDLMLAQRAAEDLALSDLSFFGIDSTQSASITNALSSLDNLNSEIERSKNAIIEFEKEYGQTEQGNLLIGIQSDYIDKIMPEYEKAREALDGYIQSTVRLAEQEYILQNGIPKTATEQNKLNQFVLEAVGDYSSLNGIIEGFITNFTILEKPLEETENNFSLLTDSVTDFSKELKTAEDSIKEINTIIDTLNQNNVLSAEQVLSLVDNYGILSEQFTKVEGGYKLEIGVLEELRQKQIEVAAVTRNAALEQTKVINSGLLDRIKAYDEEITKLNNLATTQIAVAKLTAQAQQMSLSINSATDQKEFTRLKGIIDELNSLAEAYKATDIFAKDFYNTLGTDNKNSGSSAKPETVNYNSLFDWENRENELAYNLGQKTSEEYWNGYQEIWDKFSAQYANNSKEWLNFQDSQLVTMYRGMQSVNEEKAREAEVESEKRLDRMRNMLKQIESQMEKEADITQDLVNPLEKQTDILEEQADIEERKLKLLEAEKKLRGEMNNSSKYTRVVLGANGMQSYRADPDNQARIETAQAEYNSALSDMQPETAKKILVDGKYTTLSNYQKITPDTNLMNTSSKIQSDLNNIFPYNFGNTFGNIAGQMYNSIYNPPATENGKENSQLTVGSIAIYANEGESFDELVDRLANGIKLSVEQQQYSNKNRK